MSDEDTIQAKVPGDKTLAPIAALFNAVLEKREAGILARIETQIAKLADTTDRSHVPDLTRVADNDSGTIVSRNQPTDPLYRDLLRASPQYKGARDPDQDHWNATWLRALGDNDQVMMKMAAAKGDEAYSRANLLEGTLDATDPTAVTIGSAGAYLPQSYANIVSIAKGAAAVLAPLCTNFTATGGSLRVPTMAAVTAVTASEGAAVAEANPAAASVMMLLTKLGARIIMSDELLADNAFNIMQVAGARVGEGIGVLEDTLILTTDGTSPNTTGPLAGGAVSEATANSLYSVDIATLFFALGKAYQANGIWLAGTLVATILTNLRDGNGNQILQTPSVAAGPVTDLGMPTAIGTIFGRPVYHVPATAGDLIFGDLRSFGWCTKGGIEAKVDNSVGFASDTVQFKFTERADGQMLDAAGIKEIQGITTLGA